MQTPKRPILGSAWLVLAAVSAVACSGQSPVGASPDSQAGSQAGPGAGGAEMTLQEAFGGTLGGGLTWDDIGPAQLAQSSAAYAWLTSVATPTEIAPLIAAGVGGTVLNYSVLVEATGAIELFSLFVPDSDPSDPRPLLTAFHGAGTSHGDIYFRAMDFFIEADQRDWFLIAPLQRNLNGPPDTSYASVASQLHVQAVIELVLDTYAVDRDRLYAAGFSMGGGNAMSYAARHRDRRSGAISAVVNHTGTLALANVYENAPVLQRNIMEGIFGGPPTGPVFEWRRSSVLELDAAGALLPQGRHMAVNLGSVPVQTWFNTSDIFAYLQNQALTIDGFISALPGGDHQLVMIPGGVSDCVEQHCWASLDIPAACQWLSTQSLDASPSSGTVLVDRDSRWGRFDVAQRQSAAFTGFEFSVDAAMNLVRIEETENALQLGFRVQMLGLTLGQPLFLSTGSFEAAGNEVVLRGFSSAPLSVSRNGAPLGATCGGAANANGWCYDAQAGSVTIRESSALNATWRIQ